MATTPSRRAILTGLGAAAAPAAPVSAEIPPEWFKLGFPTRRWANIWFIPTGEQFKNIYCENNEYVYDAVKQISWTCRDPTANEWKWLYVGLLDLLFILHWRYNRDQVQVLSGYRTAASNKLPRYPQTAERGSANTAHENGLALDIRLPESDNDRIALDLATYIYGGVGIYPHRDFFHVDFAGRVKQWVR